MSAPHPAPAGPSVAPSPAEPAPVVLGPPPPPNGLSVLFPHWREGRRTRGRHPRLVVAALTVALFAGLVLPGRDHGLALWLVVMATVAVVGPTFWRRAAARTRALCGVFLALVATIVIRDAGWAVSLCVLAAYALGAAALCRTRTVSGLIRAGFAVPLAWLRGLPWLRRSLPRPERLPSSTGFTLRVVRTVVVSGLLLVVLVALFASADAVFAGWVDLLTPQLPSTVPVARFMVFMITAAIVLGSAYVGLNPPDVERDGPRTPRSAQRFEWVSPVVVAITVFVTFLGAQLSALFGGHAYLQRQTGLTYADYVHQGFGQLTVASVIVLVLVGVTLRTAPRHNAADRRLIRLLIGVLGGLALVVVASALYRLHVYEQAYGFTRLRLLVSVFESWLGLVLLLATTAGVWLRARWLPGVAVLAGVLMIFALTLANPDAMIAEHNVQRYAQTGKIDADYLRSLSADAVPALDRLPEPLRSCVLGDISVAPGDALDLNLGRVRAAAVLAADPVDPAGCR